MRNWISNSTIANLTPCPVGVINLQTSGRFSKIALRSSKRDLTLNNIHPFLITPYIMLTRSTFAGKNERHQSTPCQINKSK